MTSRLVAEQALTTDRLGQLFHDWVVAKTIKYRDNHGKSALEEDSEEEQHAKSSDCRKSESIGGRLGRRASGGGIDAEPENAIGYQMVPAHRNTAGRYRLGCPVHTHGSRASREDRSFATLAAFDKIASARAGLLQRVPSASSRRERIPLKESCNCGPPLPMSVINPAFPTVIYIDSQWIDISCNICGANATRKGQLFFNGAHGLHAHIKIFHSEQSQDQRSVDEVLAECRRRIVSIEDIDHMANGEQPAHLIQKNFGNRSNAPISAVGEVSMSTLIDPWEPSRKRRQIFDYSAHSEEPLENVYTPQDRDRDVTTNTWRTTTMHTSCADELDRRECARSDAVRVDAFIDASQQSDAVHSQRDDYRPETSLSGSQAKVKEEAIEVIDLTDSAASQLEDVLPTPDEGYSNTALAPIPSQELSVKEVSTVLPLGSSHTTTSCDKDTISGTAIRERADERISRAATSANFPRIQDGRPPSGPPQTESNLADLLARTDITFVVDKAKRYMSLEGCPSRDLLFEAVQAELLADANEPGILRSIELQPIEQPLRQSFGTFTVYREGRGHDYRRFLKELQKHESISNPEFAAILKLA